MKPERSKASIFSRNFFEELGTEHSHILGVINVMIVGMIYSIDLMCRKSINPAILTANWRTLCYVC